MQGYTVGHASGQLGLPIGPRKRKDALCCNVPMQCAQLLQVSIWRGSRFRQESRTFVARRIWF
jgi:hypothetical protein